MVREDLYGAFVFQYKWKLQDIYFFHVQACLLIFKYLPDESHYKNQIIMDVFSFRYFAFITKHPKLYRFACHVFLGEKSTRPVNDALG